MNDETIKETHRLRKLLEECNQVGEYKRMSTADMEAIVTHLKAVEDSLLMFPACESARCWCIQQHLVLNSILQARKRIVEGTVF